MPRCTLGFDVGTGSSKGVLVEVDSGEVLARVTVPHEVDRPQDGWVEMDARLWWHEFVRVAQRLSSAVPGAEIVGVGISGMGPCVMLADADDQPVRPAILYGIDTRAVPIARRMTDSLGEAEVTRVGGSSLTSQAGAPKIVWIAENEPEAYGRAERLFMPASFLVRKLSGSYVLDHEAASQVTPLYDVDHERWHEPWWDEFAPGIEAPTLLWAGEIAGTVTNAAAEVTGLPAGIPVIAGSIDAWTEAISAGAHENGDLMLMYGTTMFLVATGTHTLRSPAMWTTVGARPGTRCLAGGLATSGALTSWLRTLTMSDFPTLLAEAEESGPGARGLLMLPYFAGERTPIMDPDARGAIVGLTMRHGRGDLYRAALEATGFAVRHNLETMRAAGAEIRRIVAVGGGTQGRLWTQVVSDITGMVQEVPANTVGASYGAAFLAAEASGAEPSIAVWNPITHVVRPDEELTARYDRLYELYRGLYRSTADLVHELARSQS